MTRPPGQTVLHRWRRPGEARIRGVFLSKRFCGALLRSGVVLLMSTPAGCGYRVVPPGALPPGVPCASVGAVINQTGEAGLELDLARALEDGLARRGMGCAGGEEGAVLRAELERLEWVPAVLGQSAGAAARVGAYRVKVTVAGRFEARPGESVALGPVDGELEFFAEDALPGTVGLTRTGALRQRWTSLAETLAERLILEFTTTF